MGMVLNFGTISFAIQSIFPSETQLQFSALNSDVSFEQLKMMENYTGVIKYYEDDVLRMEYKNYNGKFDCNYSSDSYFVTMNRISATDIEIDVIRQTMNDAICDLTMLVTGGM